MMPPTRQFHRLSVLSAVIVLLCAAFLALVVCTNGGNGENGPNQPAGTRGATTGNLCLENSVPEDELESMRTRARADITTRRRMAREDVRRSQTDIDQLAEQLKAELGDATLLDRRMRAIERAPEAHSEPQRALVTRLRERQRREGPLDERVLQEEVIDIEFYFGLKAIFGGKPGAPEGASSYTVMLGTPKGPVGAGGEVGALAPHCGGTLIGSNWILAAAHCPTKEGNFARVGATNPEDGEARRVLWTCSHPEYVGEPPYRHDAVLIQIADSAADDPVPLVDLGETPNIDQPPAIATLFGYGKSDSTRAEEGKLHHAELPMVDGSECNVEDFDSELMICAGGKYKAEDEERAKYRGACEMDSGSGLLACTAPGGCGTSPDSWRLIGVASNSVGGCRGQPAVFTRVSAIGQWIDKVLAQAPPPSQ